MTADEIDEKALMARDMLEFFFWKKHLVALSKIVLETNADSAEGDEKFGLELSLSGPADWWIATCRWTQERYVNLGVSRERVFQTFSGTDVSQFHSARSGKLRKELGSTRPSSCCMKP